MDNPQQCSSCKVTLNCSSDSSCWCLKLPKILTPNNTDSCMCKSCLIHAIAAKVNSNPDILTEKQKAAIAALKPTAKTEENVDYYIENNVLVMSPWYHLRRGTCCGNGCRHCPYA